MKTYQQRTQEILSRREKYIENKRKKKKVVLSTASTTICIVAVITAVCFFSEKLVGKTEKIERSLNYKSDSSTVSDELEQYNQVGESEDYLQPDEKLIVQNDITDEKSNISCSTKENGKMYTNKMLAEYFGLDYTALKVPSDLTYDKTDKRYFYLSDDGKISGDIATFNYVSDSYKSFSISVSKLTDDFGKHNETEQTDRPTKIGKKEIYVFSEYDGYSNIFRRFMTEFSYNGVNYFLEAQFLSDVEFRAILEEIIK